MSVQATEPVRIGDADIDALVDHLRRAGRPYTLEELVNLLRELWQRRRATR
jgi:hypothetical protein